MDCSDQACREADGRTIRRYLVSQSQYPQHEQATKDSLAHFKDQQGRGRLDSAGRVSRRDQCRIDRCLLRGRAEGTQEVNRETMASQQIRCNLPMLVSAPRHLMALQAKYGGGPDGNRQQDEAGIDPEPAAIVHEPFSVAIAVTSECWTHH